MVRVAAELLGFGLLIYAGWLVAEPLGYAMAGVALLNFSMGSKP